MARKIPTAPDRVPATLSSIQIQDGIRKLERRLRELEAVNITVWNDDIKNDLNGLASKVDGTLEEVFGTNSSDYLRYKVPPFWSSVSMNVHGTPDDRYVAGYKAAVAAASSKVKTALSMLHENLEDMGGTASGISLRAYEGLDLHPAIDRAAAQLYRDGHFANAIENAVKGLNDLVRARSGVDDKDGSSLMQAVFGGKSPVLKFNALQDQSDRDEQQGFMMMFSGAVAGLRNPRAHKIIEDDAQRSLEFIAFVSLLAKLLDEAENA